MLSRSGLLPCVIGETTVYTRAHPNSGIAVLGDMTRGAMMATADLGQVAKLARPLLPLTFSSLFVHL